MLSAEAFALGHLAIVIGGLAVFVILDRRSRDVRHRWHRNVRYRQITTDEVVRMIEKATRCERGRVVGRPDGKVSGRPV